MWQKHIKIINGQNQVEVIMKWNKYNKILLCKWVYCIINIAKKLSIKYNN